ncbi:FA2H-like protein [Mya arenaria]|uniref:Fatty acid 2-hydroxylase n=1 Tax=Mya arenaria TaxID=6604 RepID=A0ABY7ETJ9_MYAAR|nr:FA2H-like protein [Mya arenaria]
MATEASFRCQLKSGRYCVIHSNKIYDLTDFVDKHPGGKQLIADQVGMDVTQLMKNDIHIHSPVAYKILERFYIGEYMPHQSNGHTNGHLNGHKNGVTNGTANGATSANGVRAREQNGSSKYESSQPSGKDHLIDWSLPILFQVGSLGENYDEWVHSPIDTSLWLFRNPFVEYFSKAYWWTVLLYWVPILSYLTYNAVCKFLEGPVEWNIFGLGEVTVPAVSMPLLFVLGFLLWTLDEYIVHRWLFHCKPPSTSKFLITLHFLFHGQHHKSPMDKNRLVFPIVPGTGMCFGFYLVYRIFFPALISQVFIAGTILGYLCYDLTHYYLHFGSPSLQYFKNLKTYHVKHHFKTQNMVKNINIIL